MDKLFTYNEHDMKKKLEAIEPEMCEDLYSEEVKELDENTHILPRSKYAHGYIKGIFRYMKKNYADNRCTVLELMKELFRVASTGEYKYLHDIDKINRKSRIYERVKHNNGREEIIYAADLLQYYFNVYEKKNHTKAYIKKLEDVYEEFIDLDPLPEKEKSFEAGIGEKNNGSTRNFMLDCRKHLDKYYIGQDILKKKICSILEQWIFHDVRTTFLMVGPSGCGKNYMIETLKTFPELGVPIVCYDCSALTPNGFVGSDVKDIFKKVKAAISAARVERNLNKALLRDNDKCIVYLDEIDKIINFNHDSRGESVNAMVQQQLLSALAGTETIEGIDTSKILFILGGAFPRIDDLKKEEAGRKAIGFASQEVYTIDIKETLREQILAIGGEAEFVGRIEDIVKLKKPTKDELKQILLDENIGAFTQKKKVFSSAGLDLEIDSDTVDVILDLIVKEDAGARSVKNIMNQFADNQYYYDMKVGHYKGMRIHTGMLHGEPPIFFGGRNYYGE